MDDIGRLHAENLKRGLYSKSLFMNWRKCNLSAILQATDLVDEPDPGENRLWLKVGKRMHDTADKLHSKANETVMSSLFHHRQVVAYLQDLIPYGEYPKLYMDYLDKVVKIEADRWVKCMKYSLPKRRMIDWKVSMREMYVEDIELKMALNIDRIERVPGTVNQFALMEWKRLVRESDIRQELAWYFVGLEPYVSNHNRTARQKFGYMTPEKLAPYEMHITHWGAYGYHPDSWSFYEPIKQVSLNALKKARSRFLGDMYFARNYKGNLTNLLPIYEKIMKKPLKRIMGEELKSRKVGLMCGFCRYYPTCYTKRNLYPILFRQNEIDQGLLSSGELLLAEEYKP